MIARLKNWMGPGLLLALGVCSMSAAQAQTTPAVPTPEEAPIALLVDVTSGQVLHARNANRRFVPASITKVMTLYHAFELIEEGKLNLNQRYTLGDEAWEAWSGQGSTMWINAREQVELRDLLTGIANVSANDAAIMLAEGQAGSVAQWTVGMNARAHALNMTQSHFGTPNGWPDEGRTFTTANDLVKLAKALIERHPALYAQFIGKPGFSYNGIEQSNYDPLIGRTPGADGIKTGYTNEAGYGYLGSAERGGQRLVLVIGGSPRNTVRARAARRYIEWGFSEFGRRQLYGEAAIVGTARVQGGDRRTVDLQTDRAVFVNVPKGREAELRVAISYDGPLRAPFEAGERIATLVIDVPGMEPARVPLVASESADKAGIFARIFNGIAGWFS